MENKFVISLALILILGYTLIQFTGIPIETDRGQHNVQITAVEKSGIFFKTYSAYVKSDISSSQEEKYCIIDENVKNQLELFSRDRTKVTISYYDNLANPITKCNEDDIAIIYKVEGVK